MQTIEINESIDVFALLAQAHRGWWEYEMWSRQNGDWDDNAKPARFNPLGKVDI